MIQVSFKIIYSHHERSWSKCTKIEGGEEIIDSVKRILSAGIPVMGHLGLMPQSIYKYGTYAVRATENEEAEKLINDALLLEKPMLCNSIGKIPAMLAKSNRKLKIPVIGIGAGRHCDGQVLVLHDMLGINQDFSDFYADTIIYTLK